MNAQTTISATGSLFAATISTATLADVLKAFRTAKSHIVETRATYPILACVRLNASRDCVTISGTDADLALTVEMPADASGSGSVIVDFDGLKKAVENAQGETVRLIDQGGKVSLQHEGGAMSLPTRAVADWPEWVIFDQPRGDDACSFSYGVERMKSDLDRLAPCVSTEETRYYLNGVFFHVPEGGALTLAATDGHRCGRLTLSDIEAPGLSDSILPRKAAEWLRRKAKAFGADGDARLTFSRSAFSVQVGRARLSGKLVDGIFPDYARIIPSHASYGAHVIALGADDLAKATKQAVAHITVKHKPVTLSAGAWDASVVGVDPETGRAWAMIQGAEYIGRDQDDPDEEFSAGFNSAYILDHCAAFKGQTITIAMADAGSPALIECEATPEFILVLMPLRVDAVVYSPDVLQRLERNAVEIFEDDAQLLVDVVENATGRGPWLSATRDLAKMVTAAIDYEASRNGGDRYAARCAILPKLEAMRAGDPEPVDVVETEDQPEPVDQVEEAAASQWPAEGRCATLQPEAMAQAVRDGYARNEIASMDKTLATGCNQAGEQLSPEQLQAVKEIRDAYAAALKETEDRQGMADMMADAIAILSEEFPDITFTHEGKKLRAYVGDRFETDVPESASDIINHMRENVALIPASRRPALQPEPVEEPESEPVPANMVALGEGDPMFRTLQEFKAAAGQGTQWLLEGWSPDAGWNGERLRTVATVRARDLGFLSGSADLDACRKADVKGFGGRSWTGFPKQPDWKSDEHGLVIYYSACDQAGRAAGELPMLRLRPAPVAEEPEGDAPVDQGDEIALLRAAVDRLTERLDGLDQPQAMPEPVARRTAAHERMIRRAWAERRARREAQRHQAETEDRYIAMNELATERLGRIEGLERTQIRLDTVLKGRKAQIDSLGQELLALKVNAMATAHQPEQETPAPPVAPAPVRTSRIEEAVAPAKAPEPVFADEDDLDGTSYAAAA